VAHPDSSLRRRKRSLVGRAAIEANVHAGAYLAKREALKRALARGSLILGPWTSEVGFEVLYWIPFVQHLLAAHNVPPERVVAVSRGGVASWYAGVAAQYIDILDLFPHTRLHQEGHERIVQKRGQKQLSVTPWDREILAKIKAAVGDPGATVLHPSTMYRRYNSVWMRRRSPELVRREVTFLPLTVPERPTWLPSEPYVALKAYSGACFPSTPANLATLRDLVARFTRAGPVVRIEAGHVVDDHADVPESELDVAGLVKAPPSEAAANLGAQTAVVAHASALLAPYGGFSYLGAFLGVPTYAFQSSHAGFNSVHLELFRHALHDLRSHTGTPIPFLNFDLDAIPLLERFAGPPHE
jgi:hypothetical protein